MLSLLIMKAFRPLAALRHRNYRLFWTGQLISMTGTWMHQAAQGWLVFKLTDSPFFLGLAGMASSAPILLFTLAGGVLADRHPKKNIILLSNIVVMFLALMLAVLVAAGVVNVWHVLIISFLIGSANAFEIPSRQSFIIELVGKEDLLNGIALNSSAFNVARMVGPAVAGLIMGAFGLAPCFFINAFSFIAVVIALVKMRFKPEEIGTAPKTGMTSSLKEGIKYIFHNSDISALLIAAGIVSFFGFPYISFLPVYARDILKTGATGLGILMGCAGAGAFTGAVGLAINGDTARKGVVMAAAGIIFSAALLIFSFSTSVWLSYAMLFLVGFGAINQIATANSLLQLNVPNELRGRVMSSFTTMFLGMTPIGNLAVGSLAHYIGTQNALMTSAGFCLAGTVIVLWKKPDILKM